MITQKVIVDCKGRVLIPKEVRDRVGLQPKGKVWLIVENGKIIITPQISPEKFIEEMDGCIKKGTPAMDPLKLKKIWTRGPVRP